MWQGNTNGPEKKTDNPPSNIALMDAVVTAALVGCITGLPQRYNYIQKNEWAYVASAVLQGGLTCLFLFILGWCRLKRKDSPKAKRVQTLIFKCFVIAACVWVLFSLWHPN